jgi:anti-sigma28 factor (negative regulator of flagellin synthesis)
MSTQVAHGATGGAPHLDRNTDVRHLSREDQAAIELGFSPAGGLSWRRRRVHQLRERVEHGTYEVDPVRVAEALLARLRAGS